jgi:copper(I)-binding protein
MLRSLALASLCVAALAASAFAADEHEHDHHVSDLGGVRAIHAWTRATNADTALVFVEIENGSAGTVLLEGAESAAAATAELVGFQMKDGEPGYVVLPKMPIAAGRELVLEPEGLALRLTGLQAPLVRGDEVEVELEFDIGHMDVDVAVEAENATRHSHAGHAH